MIFVYPSVISENVKDHLFPAVGKTLEQFYLLHILESFGSGNLRVKTIYNPSKKVYGPLVLEHKNGSAKSNLLMESLNRMPPNLDRRIYQDAKDQEDQVSNSRTLQKTPMRGDPVENWVAYKAEIINALDVFGRALREINTIKNTSANHYEALISNAKPKDVAALEKEASWWNKQLTFLENDIESLVKSFKSMLETANSQIKDRKKSDDPFAADKESREKEKRDEEKKEKAARKAQTHGSYQIKDQAGLSLQPTMATVKVKIQYIGGPSQDADLDYQEIAIGTKVVPLKVENFQKIQDAILDDFFTNRAQAFFKNKTRSAIRGMFKFVEYLVKKVSGINVDVASLIKDPVKRYILLSPQGFVNAGSFKRNKVAPAFYNFTSASVVFMEDDMTYEGGENFFRNKSQLQKMFKMGWNTFVVMNDIDEKAYFISSLDGGALHILPYSYIFNALKMDKVYDSDEFKRRSRGFQTRSGGVSTLASRLNRENALYNSAKKIMLG